MFKRAYVAGIRYMKSDETNLMSCCLDDIHVFDKQTIALVIGLGISNRYRKERGVVLL